jgi:two-component system, NarL family, nitrate/nitrite response regulator NarL
LIVVHFPDYGAKNGFVISKPIHFHGFFAPPNMHKNILIVEDQGLVRAGMKHLLQNVEPEARISEAGTYEQSLALIAHTEFDIIFLDLDLREDKSGLDLLLYIREQEIPVKVIILSASDDRDTVLQCISAGASGYIAKSSGDETVFQRALITVLSDGIFLPMSIVRDDRRKPPRNWSVQTRDVHELGLSPRLVEVLYYLCQGLSNKGIADRMSISEGTVRKNYVSELLRFFNVKRRTELIIEISTLGIIIPPPESAKLPYPRQPQR